MRKFDSIIAKYRQLGVSEDNIEYAIIAVKKGAKREHIMESLTADYRRLTPDLAKQMLEDIFKANGGEFKKENRGGYIYGAFFLVVGIACSFYLYHFYKYGGTLIEPVYVWAGAIGGTLIGLIFIFSALVGVFRDKDAPFQ